MNEHKIIRNRLFKKAGISDHPTIKELRESEWSEKFEQLMRNRLVMGALRYGKLKDPDKIQYDRVASIKKRLEQYLEDGCLEHLVDVANLALLEFEEGKHPKRHWKSIDDGSHVKEKI